MKLISFLLFSVLCISAFAQPDHKYNVHLRVQAYDSTGYCNCPQDDNSEGTDCNSLAGAIITVYKDSVLYSNFYTDETGYCPTFTLPYGKYKIVVNERHHQSVYMQLDFTASDRRYSFLPSKGAHVHYRNQIADYFICVMMEGKKKDGVKIVPK